MSMIGDELSRRLNAAHAHFVAPTRTAAAALGRRPGAGDPLGAMPAEFDWRTQGILGPSRDQLHCNACTAFAIAAPLEAALEIAGRAPASIDPGFIHTCIAHGGTMSDPQQDCRTGADLGEVLGKVKQRGCLIGSPESPYPYPADRCGAGSVRLLADYHRQADAAAAAAAIARDGPIIAEMWIWKNFFDYRGDTPTYVPDPDSGGQQIHTVCVVGFDASGWIVKNSFGADWGEAGFATIAYGSCGLLSDPPAGVPFSGHAYSLELAPPSAGALVG